MDSKLWWYSIVYIIVFFLNSIQSYYLSNLIKQKHESTNNKQTSTKSINNKTWLYQSTFSKSLAKTTTTIRSNNIIQSLITKPNSYLYNSDEDDEILLGRTKRDTMPFVCKGASDTLKFINITMMKCFFSGWLLSRSKELSSLSYLYIGC